MRQTINGADFRRLVISAAAAIEINKQKLNELNVFPVPDGDTGTNMSMTINAASADLRKVEAPEGALVTLVVADTQEWRKRTSARAVKKTLTIPQWLNTAAEERGVNFSQVLQDALKKELQLA